MIRETKPLHYGKTESSHEQKAGSLDDCKLYNSDDADMYQILQTVSIRVAESVARADLIHKQRLQKIHAATI
ncbi:hypothetical protein SAMN02745752_01833 [Marinospirillum alkaliphilum DSM 21637]|uniref:Uncharacterized protein n=1 Tax=Marinospirillum alkaliphilum DSM 21637 TaxID=1122209 RepID=A0A1K1XIP9_9GAMM|nr:hypothetical protein SAMN02745752_01833 [Marinospirillum alkaliphilum DSM 21637]